MPWAKVPGSRLLACPVTAEGARGGSSPLQLGVMPSPGASIARTFGRLAPAVSARARLYAAAGLWTAVGLALGAAGLLWSAPEAASHVPEIALAVLLGSVKGRFILAPVALRNAERIEGRGDGRCLFGFLSWRGWAAVPLMMGLGFALRHSPLTRVHLGVIYVALGVALLVGAFALWRRALQAGRSVGD